MKYLQISHLCRSGENASGKNRTCARGLGNRCSIP
jgi:hypothetical protein